MDKNLTMTAWPHIRYFIIVAVLGACGAFLPSIISSSPCPVEVRVLIAYLLVSFISGWGFIDEYFSNPQRTTIKVKGDSSFVAAFLLGRLAIKLFKVLAATAIGILIFPYSFIKHLITLLTTLRK